MSDIREQAIEAGAQALSKVILPTDAAYAATVVDAVESLFRADERERESVRNALDELRYREMEQRLLAMAASRERLRERLEALLAMAKMERDAAPKADMLNDPYLYGQHMWFGGRVVGIVEALAELDGDPDE